MNRYLVVAAVAFHAGTVLGLSDAQAKARAHALEPVAKGQWRVRGRVEFKAGEEIALAGDVPKAMLSQLGADPKGRKAKAADNPPAEPKPAPAPVDDDTSLFDPAAKAEV